MINNQKNYEKQQKCRCKILALMLSKVKYFYRYLQLGHSSYQTSLYSPVSARGECPTRVVKHTMGVKFVCSKKPASVIL